MSVAYVIQRVLLVVLKITDCLLINDLLDLCFESERKLETTIA